jgi:hypothetical protein
MWTAPPVFADGNYLSAAQLNTLSDDVAHVWAAAQQPAQAFVRVTFTGTAEWVGGVRHKHRYLYYNLYLESGTHETLNIDYDGTTIYTDGIDRVPPYSWSGLLDLNSLGLTLNDWYQIVVHFEKASSSATCHLNCLWEQP